MEILIGDWLLVICDNHFIPESMCLDLMACRKQKTQGKIAKKLEK